MNSITIEQSHLRIVDIGAAGGLHSRWGSLKNELISIMFEPDTRACEQLRLDSTTNSIVLNSALSNVACDLDFHLYRDQQASSVYLPNLELLGRYYRSPNSPVPANPGSLDISKFDILESVTIKADTLDNQLSSIDMTDIDYIKLDVQGHELAIL